MSKREVSSPLRWMVCPACGHQGAVAQFSRLASVEVRELQFVLRKSLRRCDECGAEWENSRDNHWRPEAYRRYQEAKNWVTAAEIVAWRQAHGVSQVQLTRQLGWPDAKLARIENGSLQTEQENAQLAVILRKS